ncbi:electron transport complex subunit RsxC [Lachnospiraceae bacterium 38-14]|jgi:electron transport complex, RnfABCDGE type, C subunit|uniref:electron transport complex subunit RsxC n=1 Tax=Roseburia sp. 1XD42-69 TaxID=2320088 RepID=UPI000EA2EC24|nr:electron transport complex subunit RsxC [Roseburia sp. 1XD42-69]RKJ68442.1 electron transport complex subunit RsxC [Roseburia sp. 1XD42-69]
MGLMTFKGGVHPYDGKDLSKDKPVSELLPKGELVFPLSQHIGAPATPIVAVGDTVLRGQKIAEAGGFVSSPIYASVSGTVKAIEPRRVAVGDMVNSIIIESDGEMKEAEFVKTDDVTKLSNEEIIGKIKEAGVVGMGGAGFPTHVKLSPKEPDKIEYIIANCAECEPYLTSDYRRMIEQPEKLVAGMKIVLQLFPKAKGVFGVEDNKPDCIAKLKELVKDEPRMEVAELMTKYPQGGERQLIYAVTKRSINSKMLPADAGCIVDNVETLVAIYNAVALGQPLMNRIFTVTGNAVAEPQNFYICIGTNYQEMLDAAGGFKGDCKKMIAGGPMMGFALFGLNIPATKTSSALLCFTEDEVEAFKETACINCGRCVEACPELLIPSRLADFSKNGLMDVFEKWHGLECVECGSCSFVCPAKRPLAQAVKTMKKQALAAKRKK